MPWFRQPQPTAPAADALFGLIEAWQGRRPWGHVLDAGTGDHSLRWLRGLDTARWTAVTGGHSREQALRRTHDLRPGDRILTGNWSDPQLLAGETFDVVLADYLLGALDGFAPYFQERLFARLRPHVAGRLYAVGLEPYPDPALGQGDGGQAGAVVREIARLRDACILLAGHRCYREYPRAWVERQLRAAGFRVLHAESVDIVYRARFIDGQLDVCARKLPHFRAPPLARAMEAEIERLRTHAHAVCDRLDGLRFGQDWVVAAEPG